MKLFSKWFAMVLRYALRCLSQSFLKDVELVHCGRCAFSLWQKIVASRFKSQD